MSQVFSTPLWIRLLVVACAVFMGMIDLALAAAWLLGAWEPGMEVAAGVFGLMSVLSVVVVVQNLRRAIVHGDHVEFGLPLLSRRVGLHEIQRVEHQGAVRIHTARGVYRCKLAMRDPQARFVKALEEALPEDATRVVRALPWTWRPRREVVLSTLGMTLAFGPGAAAMGLGMGVFGLRQGLAGNWEDAVGGTLGMLLLLALAVLLTGAFAWTFRWRVDFGTETLVEVFPVRRRRHAISQLRDIGIGGETRTHKGRSRQAWWLALRFEGNDEEVRIELTENGMVMAHNAEADRLELERLCADLRELYGLDAAASSGASGPSPASALAARLEELRGWEGGTLAEQFESLRDELAAHRDPDGLLAAVLLLERDHPAATELRELLVTILADFGHGPAMEHMVRWLQEDDDQLRFVAAMALDQLAGGVFDVDGCIQGGWVQHGQIRAKVPEICAWWTEAGRDAAAARTRHHNAVGLPPEASPHDKRCNFLESNPEWAMLGDGEVRPPSPAATLPRGRGVHLVGGTIHEAGGQSTVFAVFAMDPDQGAAVEAWVRGKTGWLARRRGRDRWEPRWTF